MRYMTQHDPTPPPIGQSPPASPSLGPVFDPTTPSPEMRALILKWQKTPFSERIYDFERALATYTVFFLFFWGAFIAFSLAGIRINSRLISSFSVFLLNVDQGFILLGFLSFLPSDRLITFSLIIGWTASAIYARIKFGQLYYIRSLIYAGVFQMAMTIGLLILVLFPVLLTTIIFSPSSAGIMAFFLVIVGIYFGIAPLIFGLIGVLIGMITQNEVYYRPIKRLVPGFLVSPYSTNVIFAKQKMGDSTEYCPFRMKKQPGCRFLGLRASNLSLICDDPRYWMHHCALYHYLTKKIGGDTLES